jgi:hypothetical protein
LGVGGITDRLRVGGITDLLGVGRVADRRFWRSALLVGLSCVAVAGCGSSSSSSGSTGTTTSAGTAAGGSTSSTPAPPSSGSSGSAGVTSPAKARYIAQADQVCNAADTALASPQEWVNAALKAEQTKGTAAHRQALASAVRAEAAAAGAEVSQLRKLSPPSGQGTGAGDYVAAVASQVKLIDQLAATVAANNGTALKSVGDRLAAGRTKVDQLARAYGYKICGRVPS